MTIAPVSPISAPIPALAGEPAGTPAPAAAAAKVSGASFNAALDAAVEARARVAGTVAARGSRGPEDPTFVQFESFVLRTFVESMLPKENESFFGSGTAGGIWRSMLAERIGEELARGGGIGIADMLAESRAPAVPGTTAPRDVDAAR